MHSALFPKAWLPPGAWVCHAELEDIAVTDEAGNKIEAGWHPDLETVRRPGLPTSVGLGTLTILPKNLEGLKSVTLRATFRWGYARDLERFVLSPIPGKLKLASGIIAIDKLTKDPDKEWWDLSLNTENGDEGGTMLLSVEDDAGRWMGDLMTLTLRPGGSMGTSRSASLRPGTPARCIVNRAVGVDLFEAPFSLTVPAH
jgi:hypothetical protein